MKKIAVVYWSGTGNTEMMAKAIESGAKDAGANVELFTSDKFNGSLVSDYDGIAFGCPSMGAEVLEESEFKPMWDEVKHLLSEIDVVLFGSYGWGDGEWLRNWEVETVAKSVTSYMCNAEPDAAATTECENLGRNLSN